MDNNIGKKLDGRYELLELIGVGGMADIYKARDITEDRIVAVKILKNEFVGSEDFIRRFRNESKAIALLSHPNIVKIFDVGFTDKLQFIVMEYIDGITLTDYIAKQGALKWKDVVHFTMQILKALQHAHDRGIVHRDIKPQNVMLLEDGTIKVMDFGIARFNRETDKTISEKAIGSVHYISPEQARGEITDERSDIYSVGIMLYEMLTGKKPFDGDSPVSIALMHMQSTAKKMSDVNPSIPEGLEEITEKAMQKEPSKRYQTAGEMISDIEQFKKNPSIVFEYKYFSTDGTTKYFDRVTPESAKPQKNSHTASQELKPRKGYVMEEDEEEEEELEEEEEDEVEPRRSPLLSVLFAVTAVFIIVAAIVVYKLVNDAIPTENNTNVTEILVPTLVGLTEDEVRTQYGDLNILIVRDNDSAPQGQVIYQSIGAGSPIKATQQIKITVSLGPKMEEIDEFKGRPREEAVTQLTHQGFQYEISWMDNDEIPNNYVIRTDPPARTRAEVGTKVTIFVSRGPSPTLTVVPDFKNLKEAVARENATRNDLVLLVEYGPSEDEEFEEGRVMSQDIEPNEKVEKGTVVTVVVCNGKESTKSSSINLTIGDSVSGEFIFKYYIDGRLENSETRDVSLNKQIDWNFSDSGVKRYAIVVEKPGGNSMTLIENEVDFTVDPPEKKQITFNSNVFSQLSSSANNTNGSATTTSSEETEPPVETVPEETEPEEFLGF
ncbi:MAG: Stk1 family PASTA domain-containing Ser/Thr kinase [Firmicutes bacterium]|nr:Stk1 family PASTA domain-containing Ser/Thr kinase [[Eubacterium] siraeum]MCM1489107.1 Stk1 family PASTA domain-containing Ser/Thr kinase [Bacillota bacterium]